MIFIKIIIKLWDGRGQSKSEQELGGYRRLTEKGGARVSKSWEATGDLQRKAEQEWARVGRLQVIYGYFGGARVSKSWEATGDLQRKRVSKSELN